MTTVFDPDKHHRRSIRLPGYDYAQPGAYFVTICTQDRVSLFGAVSDGKMRLNRIGGLVAESWEWLAARHPRIALDQWVVMPNHLHGVIVMVDARDESLKGGSRTALTGRNAVAAQLLRARDPRRRRAGRRPPIYSRQSRKVG